MKRVFLLLFTLILTFFSAFSYASFPVISDTVQVQKETLEEYQLRIQKQGVFTKKNSEIYGDSKIIKKWNSKSIGQKLLLIIALLLFLLYQLLKNAEWSGPFLFDFSDL